MIAGCERSRERGDDMKVSREQVAENRERILDAAARMFRERGMSGAGVDALMQAAGLSHGSLYSQFGSKEGLVTEALSFGFECAGRRAREVHSATHAVKAYLSAEHRDNPGHGCFMAALGCDMSRQSQAVRHSFTQIVRGNIARLVAVLKPRRGTDPEDDALAVITTMVGAMVLARAVDDSKFSDRILSVSRARLLERM
jgi:TetR/AcrR family transcriptional repressor of nem operon